VPCRSSAAWATPATSRFEHIYRHHRRYRITEGAEEVQMRRVAGQLFGFL
jgi:alkylation response protein AidB-like acyl-CoA dehydrogenase